MGFDLDLGSARVLGERMCARIAHRGPDGGGVEAHRDATIGMKRLAIVDLEHGNQPMLSDDGSLALVYNGEIYNAPALRKELERDGVVFRTRSDTEVILRLYERNPDDVERHLVGMWAFAIHDRRRKRLTLSRDRFGIKPLFIVDGGRELAFASEMKAFEPIQNRFCFSTKFSVDYGAAHAMLSWGYVPELFTIYQGVTRLEPGTRLTIDLASGVRATDRYWALTLAPDAARVRSLEEACEYIEPLLKRAVREHLESDVPVATFLSGGIDSSLVAAYAAEASTNPIEAFTIGFVESRFDEAPHARQVAERLGMKIHVEYLDAKTARASLADAIAAYDEPFGDSSSLATFLLAQRVSTSHKVALAGDGGDEVFAGYRKHRIIAARQALHDVPGVRNTLGNALAMLPSRTDRSTAFNDALRVLRKASRGLIGDDARAYVALTQLAPMTQTAHLVNYPGDPERFESPARERFRTMSGTQLQRTLACDLSNPLPNDMLTKVDRATMARHLEARVPFLDHRVVEAGLGLPERFSLGDRGKAVLRALFERRFGREAAQRKKQGFGVPVETWLRNELRSDCQRLFARDEVERQGLFAVAEVGGAGWERWAARDPQLFWNAFTLASWMRGERGTHAAHAMAERQNTSSLSGGEANTSRRVASQ